MGLDIVRIVLCEVRIDILELWSLQVSLPVADPSLGKQQSVVQIVVADLEFGAIELQDDETVVAHVDVFVRHVTAVVIQDAVAIGDVWNGTSANRHTAMAYAAPVSLNAVYDSKSIVNRKPVFMTPKPENRPVG